MDAKKYLSQAYYLDQRIDAKIEQIENLRALAAKTTAAITDMPFNHSQTHQAMSEAICKIIDLQNEIAVEAADLIALKREIAAVIKTVSSQKQRALLEFRYLCGMTWRRITFEMGCGKSSVFRIHDAALKNIKIS